MAETLTDPMAGYDPSRTDVPQPAAPAQPAGYEFDPRKEIDPMAGSFFSQVEANPNLSPEAKLRVQTKYLAGLEDIQAQRQKIEGERLRNTLNRQEIERSNLALSEARRKQEDAMRAAERQKGVADTLKGIRDSDLPPEEKQRQFNEAKISLAGDYVTNPTVKTIFDTVESGLPKPPEPLLSRTDVKSLIVDKNVPTEIALLAQENPEVARVWMEMEDIRKKGESNDAKQINEARKQRTEMTLALAKEPPKFFTEENLPDTVSSNDPNRLKYLTPESQQRGRDLMLMAYGPDAVAAYNQLATDADRYEAIREARDKVLLGLVEDLQKPETEAATDNTVDSLLFGTKKR
jgi:hypothetical protein